MPARRWAISPAGPYAAVNAIAGEVSNIRLRLYQAKSLCHLGGKSEPARASIADAGRSRDDPGDEQRGTGGRSAVPYTDRTARSPGWARPVARGGFALGDRVYRALRRRAVDGGPAIALRRADRRPALFAGAGQHAAVCRARGEPEDVLGAFAVR